MGWQQDVIRFWFELGPEQWWKLDPELDREVEERFRALWEEQRQCPVDTFLRSPEEALAAVILFDQFPRNMFRDHADSFATDHLALAIAKRAIDLGHDEALGTQQRGFLYMPFQHSEDLDDQLRSIGLFSALGNEEQLRYAHLHHDVVKRFGRFPHRNAMLGRKARPDEIAAGEVVPW